MAKGFMSDDERALESAGRRATTNRPTEEDFAAADEDTSPFELLCEALADDEVEDVRQICDRLGVDPESPATIRQVFRVARRQNRKSGDVSAAAKRAANSAMKVAGAKTPPLDRLAAVERKVKLIYVALGTALTLAGGSVVTVAKGLYERGADDGALRIRLEHQERDLERLRLELRDVERPRRRTNGAVRPHATPPADMPDPRTGPVSLKGLSL